MRVEVTNTTASDITVASLNKTFRANETVTRVLNSAQYFVLRDTPGLSLFTLEGSLKASYGTPKRQLSWFMSDDTFLYLCENDPEMIEKFGTDILYVNGPANIETFGLNRIKNNIRADADVIIDNIQTGVIGSGEAALWIAEKSGGANEAPTEQLDDIPGTTQRMKAVTEPAGVTLMVAPGLTAATYLDPTSPRGDDRDEAYMNLGLARQGAMYADVSESQTQHLQHDLPDWDEFVRVNAAQAHKASGGKPHLVGLTTVGVTYETDTSPTPEEIAECAYRALPFVSGFWLNAPPSDEPHMNGAKDYQKALEALQMLDW